MSSLINYKKYYLLDSLGNKFFSYKEAADKLELSIKSISRLVNNHKLSKKNISIQRIDLIPIEKKCSFCSNIKKLTEFSKNKNRLKTDYLYKLEMLMRNRFQEVLQNKNWRKNNKIKTFIDCSILELKNHIEKQFQPGMTWENHGLYSWHIDHIIPLNSAKTEQELCNLFHYKNLQPLWAKDNIRKSDKIE